MTVRIVTADPQRPSMRDLSPAGDSNTVGFCLGDIVPDGRVDLVDFAEISNGWLNPEVDCTNPDNKDLSGDCMVNLEDILIFATYWLLD